MGILRWLTYKSARWRHLQQVPLRKFSVLLLAASLLFSVTGFFSDLMGGGVMPYAEVVVIAILGGLNAAAWILTLARLPTIYALLLAMLGYFTGSLSRVVNHWVQRIFHVSPVSPKAGMQFCAISILVVVIASYVCFITYIRSNGREVYRLQTELALAHSIQQTLVPTISQNTESFAIYGISKPSEKVGGDLVDAVELRGGDTIAYLADIAGHGLQAGILMGMLKTAARTALLDGASLEHGATLSMLMERLNRVLPGVKEAHMYATFTALRLNADGQSFYGMAASPPLLHWSAARQSVARIEEAQFPLALLPVSVFPAHAFTMEPCDLAVIATDGILEVSSPAGTEFGVDALEALLHERADMPLSELAAAILAAVHMHGKQLDDQTLLLVRRHALSNMPTPAFSS